MDDATPVPPDPFAGLLVTDTPPGHGDAADRRWAAAVHLSALALPLVGPLAVVLSKGERSPFVGHHALEAVNFQTTALLALLLCAVAVPLGVGLVLLPVVVVTTGVLAVRAAADARRGAWGRYRWTLRVVP